MYVQIAHNNKANSKEKRKNTCSGDTPSLLHVSITDSFINVCILVLLVDTLSIEL